MKTKLFLLLLLIPLLTCCIQQSEYINRDETAKTITITDGNQNLSLVIDYSDGCRITQATVKGQNTLSPAGVYSSIRTDNDYFSSVNLSGDVKVSNISGGIKISNIVYGDLEETWTFRPTEDKINWTIERIYAQDMLLEDMSFPSWTFADLSVWKGGIFDNGGMVWCKYINKNNVYGVHTAGVTFWNPETNHAFRIIPKTDTDQYLAAKYTQNEAGEFICTQYVTPSTLKQRYQQERYVVGRTDVFAPFEVKKGQATMSLDLQYIDYAKEYSRGTLPGIDAEAVRELLNTTGRYGVVDNNIIGANGWVTNWKCLHEPFFAQVGMALNDKNYTANFSATLDQERDLAILDDGRVLSRWHGVSDDEIPGTYNPETGYYEAKWGYTVDSQTGQIINTAEQFNLCGDVEWLKSHKASSEKVLDWLIRRDVNNNGIFEMVNNNIAEEKASDWVDIVWAGFENAFVNAQMYEALNLWANCETVLGDTEKAAYYSKLAARLKEAFNKPITEGGFWYPEKKQYVYWRDNDGSIHGDNMVTPVNFAAIAFGICDDPNRINEILGEIEKRTVAENLFHWPLCFDSYKREEVSGGNWPFPRYENGDIFPTWGYLGVRSYINYDKDLALKYIRNILAQYNKDGLSSQRYSRTTQLGEGTDILAGISTTITALYRDIYGIRPKWNRMGLEPNMLQELNGTEFNYVLRDTVYSLKLSVDNYEMNTNDFAIKSKNAFGASMKGNKLVFYPFNKEEMLLTLSASSKNPINMEVGEWTGKDCSFTVTSTGKYTFAFEGLTPNSNYELSANNEPITFTMDKNGKASFSQGINAPTTFRLHVK